MKAAQLQHAKDSPNIFCIILLPGAKLSFAQVLQDSHAPSGIGSNNAMSRARSSSRYGTSERAPYQRRAARIAESPLKTIGSLFRNQSPDPDNSFDPNILDPGVFDVFDTNMFDTDVPQRRPRFEDEVKDVWDSMKTYETKLKQRNRRWEKVIGRIATLLTIYAAGSYLLFFFSRPSYSENNKQEMHDAISSLMFDLHRVPNMTIMTTHPRTGIDRYLEGARSLSLLSKQVENSNLEFKNKVTPLIDDATSSIAELSR